MCSLKALITLLTYSSSCFLTHLLAVFSSPQPSPKQTKHFFLFNWSHFCCIYCCFWYYYRNDLCFIWCCHPHKTLFPKTSSSGTFEVSLSFAMCPVYWFHMSHPHPVQLTLLWVRALSRIQSFTSSCNISSLFPSSTMMDRRDLHSILSPAWSLSADYTSSNLAEWAQKLTLSFCVSFSEFNCQSKNPFFLSLLLNKTQAKISKSE